MRYFTEAERQREQKRESERVERRRWMTLVEAIKYIKDKGRLGDHEALEDIFRAIVDGKVKALSGDVSYEEESISEYDRLSPGDLQRELKVCLDGPGFIKLGCYPPKAKKRRNEIIEYPKISIVAGPIAKVAFDKSDPYRPPIIPKVDELEYGPVLVFRDDLEKRPFAPEEKPLKEHSASNQVSNSEVPIVTSKVVEATKSKGRGRPRGSGSWEGADAPVLTEMRRMIESGAAKSPNDAATQVAGKARGSGTVESRAARLAKRYRIQYPSERK
jgi:hypothetical protein